VAEVRGAVCICQGFGVKQSREIFEVLSVALALKFG
jgi:hypothetical protein